MMIQKLGLEQMYREDESFSEFCRKLDGLAFLPLEVVKVGMAHLVNIMTDHVNELVDYFDKSYVNGTYRQIGIFQERLIYVLEIVHHYFHLNNGILNYKYFLNIFPVNYFLLYNK